jgi:hypothetical protein
MHKCLEYNPQVIADYCKKHDLTTKQLADAAGMGLSTVNAIRCRVYPNGPAVAKLLNFIKTQTPSKPPVKEAAPDIKKSELVEVLNALLASDKLSAVSLTFRVSK